jgi:hypothetical protein
MNNRMQNFAQPVRGLLVVVLFALALGACSSSKKLRKANVDEVTDGMA